MGAEEEKRQSARRTPLALSKLRSMVLVPISGSSLPPLGRKRSSVKETLIRGQLPPQFDHGGLITTGSWREAKTSLMRTVSLDMPPVLADTNNDWRDHAYCKGNPNVCQIMFAHNCVYSCTKSDGRKCNNDRRVKAAKEFCAKCPVLDYCLYWAVVTNLLHGVAGGLTSAERLVIRKKLKADPYGAALLRGDIELHDSEKDHRQEDSG
jgi:WhiB family transcriptional regulator, redox-sensing transcriptional regulator